LIFNFRFQIFDFPLLGLSLLFHSLFRFRPPMLAAVIILALLTLLVATEPTGTDRSSPIENQKSKTENGESP
jgi:hypothetical protein